MKLAAWIITAVVASMSSLASGAQPAPAETTSMAPGTYMSQKQIADALAVAIAKPSDPAISPIGVTTQYSISEAHRTAAGVPAIHPAHTELHFILEGSGTFVTGGRIVTPPGSKDAIIEGGVARKVTKGDAVLVPQNTPHWYQQIDGGLTYLEVRFMLPAATASP